MLLRRVLIRNIKVIILFCVLAFWLIKSLNEREWHEDDKTSVEFTELKCEPFHNQKSIEYQVVFDNVTYPQYTPLYLNKTLNFECLNRSKKPKVILLWNKWFGDASFKMSLDGDNKPFVKMKCPTVNCHLTNDKNLLNESQLVIFHIRDKFDLPSIRYSNQRYVFLLFESPQYSYDYTKYNRVFNLSATYRHDSDFFGATYGKSQLKWGLNKDFNENQDIYETKTNFAAILMSNCDAVSRRMDYIKEMQKHVNIDIYGKCGIKCPKTLDNGTKADCRFIIAAKYKFFLAFENSLCSEYITEKFFFTLYSNIVPVVYGSGPYQRHVPKSAYIDVFDYKTPLDLVNYLKYVDSDRNVYNSFFKWRQHLIYDSNAISSNGYFCEMCIKLNLEEYFGVEKKIIENMAVFWNKSVDCELASIVNGSLERVKY